MLSKRPQVLQSMTMKPLLRRLGITARDPVRLEYETRHARLLVFRAAAVHLDEMQRDGLLSQNAWEMLKPQLLGRVEQMSLDVRSLQRAHPELAQEELAHLEGRLAAVEFIYVNGVTPLSSAVTTPRR